MKNVDPKAKAKAKATRDLGLLPQSELSRLKPGSVWWTKDKLVSFPEARIPSKPARVFHEGRPVVVLQDESLCAKAERKTVIVVPCSTKSEHAGAGDLVWEDVEPFQKGPIAIYATLIQPLLKSDLDRFMGAISVPRLTELRRMVLQNMGLVQAARLPPKLPPNP